MTPVEFSGHRLNLHPDGAAYWRGEGMLIVSDLMLSMSSEGGMRSRIFQPGGGNLETLARLENILRETGARRLLVLGDGFIGDGVPPEAEMNNLEDICAQFQVFWITSNAHAWTPSRAHACEVFSLSGLSFRHRAAARAHAEISGYFRPVSTLPQGAGLGTSALRKAFVEDGARLIMPAFGDYSDGADIVESGASALFAGDYRVHVAGFDRIHTNNMLREAA